MNGEGLENLNHTSKNPRRLTAARRSRLAEGLAEFGSLDGVVNNVLLNELVGGNQRTDLFREDKTAEIEIAQRYDEPTATGTVAYGYVVAGGERFPYREVHWEKAKHMAAVRLANESAGEWDLDALREHRSELLELEDGDFYDELTYFTDADWTKMEDGWVEHTDEGPKPEKPKEPRWTLDQLRSLKDDFKATENEHSADSFISFISRVAYDKR